MRYRFTGASPKRGAEEAIGMRLCGEPRLDRGWREHHAAADTLDGDRPASDEAVDRCRLQSDEGSEFFDRHQAFHCRI